MSRWFRLHDEMLDDPKVQRLHPALFKVLINLWCVASRHDGRLPAHSDMSFALRMSEDETFRAVSKLVEAGLIDTDATTGEQRPHGWDARQFRSDVSTDRVRAHRERQKTAKKDPPKGGGKGLTSNETPSDGNDHETFHGTPPEAETETDNTIANAMGTVVPISAGAFCKAIFDSTIPLLMAADPKLTERNARSVIGRWRKDLNDDATLLTLISDAQNKSQPLDWLMAAVETRIGTRKPAISSSGRKSGLVDELRATWAEAAEENSAGDQGDGAGAWLALPSANHG
jgi:hypothetical protein